MKKIVFLICIILIIGCVAGYFYINKEQNVKQVVSTVKTIDFNQEQLDEIAEEKKLFREKKENIEYVYLNPNDVKIPILMYHSISDTDPNNTLLVSPIQFEEEMKWLKKNNFTPMLLGEVIEAFKTGKVPKKPVAITFDDGYADNYTEAYQILKKSRMKATFFIITDNIDNDGYYMSSDMLKEMDRTGMDIENHTSNHRELNKLSKEDQTASILNGKDALKRILGKDSKYLCYPVGRYNDTTIEVQKELGVEAAVTTNGGIASANDGEYNLTRIRVSPMTLEKFIKIFSEFTQ